MNLFTSNKPLRAPLCASALENAAVRTEAGVSLMAGRQAMLLFLLTMLIGCSSSESPSAARQQFQRLPTDAEVEQYNAQVDPEDRIVCRDEIPVGTNIPQRRCYRAQALEEVGRFHREQLRNVLR